MTSLGLIVLGHVLVVVDLRVPALDVVPDPLGWVLVVVGLTWLVRLDTRFSPAQLLAVLAGVLSLADLVHPVVTTTTGIGTTTGAVPPTGLHGLLSVGHDLAGVLTAVLLTLALRSRAREHGDGGASRTFTGLAVALPVVGLAGVALPPLVRATDAKPPGLFGLLLVLAVLAVAVWFLLALLRHRTEPWLQPPVGATQPQP